MMKLQIMPVLQTVEVRHHETAGPGSRYIAEHYTSYWQIHDYDWKSTKRH